MENCIFCKIINGEIPSTKVYEDDLVYAFNDLEPTAPLHCLIVPKKHICCANEIMEEDEALIGHIFRVAVKIAKEKGFSENGYRIVNNCGKDAGQTVFHIHFHLLAGREFGWPAG
ncbi:MAG: histidine triad nucleotide-binding protein [Clostridia bacterium]|nr:histidine triad nucleotide-binding protein [Clostridia bacterium]